MVRRVATQEQPAAGPAGSHPLVDYAVASSERKFRAIVVACAPAESSESLCLPAWAQQALGVAPGDNVICVRI
jgi:arginine N-succinyltransferase